MSSPRAAGSSSAGPSAGQVLAGLLLGALLSVPVLVLRTRSSPHGHSLVRECDHLFHARDTVLADALDAGIAPALAVERVLAAADDRDPFEPDLPAYVQVVEPAGVGYRDRGQVESCQVVLTPVGDDAVHVAQAATPRHARHGAIRTFTIVAE